MIEEKLRLDLAEEILKKFLPAELHDEILAELKGGRFRKQVETVQRRIAP